MVISQPFSGLVGLVQVILGLSGLQKYSYYEENDTENDIDNDTDNTDDEDDAMHQTTRRDICHKHHKQRLCKIISTRVKFHFVNVLLEQFMYLSFNFFAI